MERYSAVLIANYYCKSLFGVLIEYLPPLAFTEVEVLYPYEPKQDDELRLQVGDIIRKVTKQEAGWYFGVNRSGDTGVFPDNFVKVSFLKLCF